MKKGSSRAVHCLVYFFSRLFPRRSDLWAFGCIDNEFADNTKYLFLWVSANCPDIKAVWITSSVKVYSDLIAKGYRAELRGSLTARLVAVRAKLHVFCYKATDVYFPYSGGCLHINLWHGVGIKNLQYAIKNSAYVKFFEKSDSFLFRLKEWETFREPDMFLSTSKMMSQHFSKCFRIPVEHCPQIGYPRLDIASDENLKRQALAFGDYSSVDKAFEIFDEVYLYMPTWRDSGRDFLKDAFPDLNHLSRVLASRNAVLYVKLHRNTRVAFPTASENIRRWPDGLDFYPVLDRFDALITDYSSILYDWIFLKDRGVVLYAFDYDTYMKTDHDFAFPFEENIVGVRANDFEGLCTAIQTGAVLAPLPKEKLALLRERFWGRMRPLSSVYLADYLKRLASCKL